MIIYKTTNLVNGKQYIGRDSHNNPNYLGSGPLLKKAIKKYGKENFKKEVIEECSSFEQMVEREEYWLNYYEVGNNPMFYNLQNSGKGVRLIGEKNPMFGKKHSDESKKKISEERKGKSFGEKNPMFGKEHSIETRQKISKSSFGKKMSIETRNKISKRLSGENHPFYGKHHSEETRNKIGNKNRGKKPSDETRKLFSEMRRGEKNNMFGKKHSVETIKLLSEMRRGKYKGEMNPMYGNGHLLSGEKNGRFKSYVVCVSGDFVDQKKIATEWARILSIKDAGVYSHLSGKRYKNGIKGNFFKWEHEIQS